MSGCESRFKELGGYSHIDAPKRVQLNEDCRINFQANQTMKNVKEFKKRSSLANDEPEVELV